jgi:hypothetical protein
MNGTSRMTRMLVIAFLLLGLATVEAGSPPANVCETHQGAGSPWCERAAQLECERHRSFACLQLEHEFNGSGGGLPPWFLPPAFDDTAQLTPLILSVPETPQPFRATDKQYHLVYELQLLNFGTFGAQPPSTPVPTLIVTEILIQDGEHPHGPPLLILSGEALTKRMQLLHLGFTPDPEPGAPSPSSTQLTPGQSASQPDATETEMQLPSSIQLTPGQSAMVFLDVIFPDRQSVPKSITNRVKVAALPGTGQAPVVDLTELHIQVEQTPVITIGPFLRGGGWANFNGCCDVASPHRRVGRSVNGQEYWPERYAVDVIKAKPVGNQYKVFRNDGAHVEDWFGTGEDVLAVVDGIVSRVVTGQPNNAIGQPPFPPIVATGGGNEVVVYLGDGIFTMYAHLVSGSVSAYVGQRVRRGDVLGKLGNTGQSTAPHLHFQVMDNNSIGASQGVPWVFDKFTLLGTFDGLSDNGALTGFKEHPLDRRMGELPLEDTLIAFPN